MTNNASTCVVGEKYRRYLEDLDAGCGSEDGAKNFDTRQMGLAALAKHEEDKKVRSGLVRLYSGFSTKAVANALRISMRGGDNLAVQAATECLAQRRDYELLAAIFAESEMTEAMEAILGETLSRHDGLSDLLLKTSAGRSVEREKELHDKFVTSFSETDILGMEWRNLRSIVRLYEELGVDEPRERIALVLRSTIASINEDYSAGFIRKNVDDEVAEFLGLTGKTDG